MFDKKLFLYLVVLAVLAFFTFKSVRAMNEEEGLTAEDQELLIETGYFEFDTSQDELVALYEEDLSLKDLNGGEAPSGALRGAYERFQGGSGGGSPIMTFVLFILTGILAGFLVVVYVLPNFVQKASEEVFGSTEALGADPQAKAQAMVAQGQWEEAIAAYREVAEVDVSNRLPWGEMAMLKRDKLEEPAGAVAILDEALARGDWRENDEAFFIFRKIEIFETDLNEHEKAVTSLKEVMEKFPQTRHAANAMHKLRELGEA